MGLLSAEIDPTYLAKIETLVPTEWQIIGVRVPKIRAIAATLHKANKSLSLAQLITMLDSAFAKKQREPVLCYIFWLQKHQRSFDLTLWSAIDRWIEVIIDWEICDQLAMSVGAALVAKDLSLVDELVAWTSSGNLWRRRFTVATAAALNHKGRRLSDEALRICQPLLGDSETMVRKAVGWALREASKHDADAVYQLLLANKTRAHRSVLREGSAKLRPKQRETLTAK